MNATQSTPSRGPQAAAGPIHLNHLGWRDPFRWLARGWADYHRHPIIGSIHGLCFALMGWALSAVFAHAPAYTLALSAGFLLLGPLLCMGLYQVSLEHERGLQPVATASFTAARGHWGQIGVFGFVLLVLEMLWGRASLVIFAVTFDGMPDFKGSVLALLNPENVGFIVTYLCVGSVFAGLIFAISVVSIPMMLDRREVDAITAALTSLRLCLTQTGVMLLWGVLITLLVVAALLPWFLGLVVVGPVLGHASWHAYRGAVAWRAD